MTPRYWSRKVDANQAEIVAVLRAEGWSVQPIHRLGQGVPDLLVGAKGRNILLEVKDGDGALTDDELSWHANWQGQVDVVRSAGEAVAMVRTVLWRKPE